MAGSPRTEEREPDQARLIRSLRRQVAQGALLATFILIDHYLQLGSWQVVVHAPQVWLASVLALDVLVRPVLLYLLPEGSITVHFGKYRR